MRDYFELGPSPVEEDCLQMGEATNDACRAECVRYKELLERVRPIPPHLADDGVRYRVHFFPYDAPAGGYYEVVLCYDDNGEGHVAFAHELEGTLPLTWEG